MEEKEVRRAIIETIMGERRIQFPDCLCGKYPVSSLKYMLIIALMKEMGLKFDYNDVMDIWGLEARAEIEKVIKEKEAKGLRVRDIIIKDKECGREMWTIHYSELGDCDVTISMQF